jgi:hypothetical protein
MPIFQDILRRGTQAGFDPARTKTSREWYRNAASQVSSLTVSTAMRQFEEKKKLARPKAGYMYLFKYDPKTKATLPYYDTFPLVFPVEPYKDGFLGINMHYLPHILRARLMNALYSTTNNKNYDNTTKIQITYQILLGASKYRAFKPTLKRYLYSHVGSPFLQITAREWDIALFLPLERFKKSDKETIWSDSKSMI